MGGIDEGPHRIIGDPEEKGPIMARPFCLQSSKKVGRTVCFLEDLSKVPKKEEHEGCCSMATSRRPGNFLRNEVQGAIGAPHAHPCCVTG
jgi:hypothetical protein